jgi:L-ascorbate metabolism protein UlaG (beta-lactamase superfamily)
MKVTKYPQSCLLLEKNERRIVIDPGSFFAAAFSPDVLGDVSAVLYTHQHADHYDEALAKQFIDMGVAVYGNDAVAALVGERAKIVTSGQSFNVGGFEIMPHDLPHCEMVDGSAGPPNTGYIIDGNFFHAGDGIETEGVHVANMAVAITGPSISFRDAALFAQSVGARKVIPMHYDNVSLFIANPHGFERAFAGAEVIVLENGQSVEL